MCTISRCLGWGLALTSLVAWPVSAIIVPTSSISGDCEYDQATNKTTCTYEVRSGSPALSHLIYPFAISCIDNYEVVSEFFVFELPQDYNDQFCGEVYGMKSQQSGHGDLEEAALNISKDPKLADKEMYEKLGRENVGRAGTDPGFSMMPAWATTRYPETGTGFLDFNVEKAKEYTKKKSDLIAETFLEAIRRWEMMEEWKK